MANTAGHDTAKHDLAFRAARDADPETLAAIREAFNESAKNGDSYSELLRKAGEKATDLPGRTGNSRAEAR